MINMRCPRQERIEQLAAGSDDPALPRVRAHVAKCPDCQRRLELAQAERGLLNDLRELAESRSRIKPLFDGMSSTG